MARITGHMRLPILILLSLVAGSAWTHAEAPAPLTLADVFAEIRAKHPSLAAARASTKAAQARIAQESAWADPRLGIGVKRGETNSAASTTRLDTYNELEVSLSQEIPLSGRNQLRAKAASAEAGVADSETLRREWMLFNQARTSFTRLAAADERLTVNRRLHENLAQTLALARQTYETGTRPQSEVLTLQTELAQLDADRTDLESVRSQESAALNALMLRPVETPISPLTLPPATPPALSLSEAVVRARAMSPDITVALKQVDAAQARLAVARKNRTVDPEFSITARHMKDSGDAIGSYDTAISFSLPWFHSGRTDGERREALGLLASAKAEASASEAEIAGMVASAHARASADYTQVKRYEDELVPLARASADAARRDYETGRAQLPSVLIAEKMLLETELKLTDTRAEQALASAELCFLTSEDVTP
ncbi:MAG TPA: TolC family protein [Rariglobus sp.]|jgi:outer membrane protein TolC|nr:TolC family protein [Rariglobus sp.]